MSEKLDKQIIIICVVNVLSLNGYAIIAPFLPIELQNKGIDQAYFGTIFSMYSIAVALCSPLVSIMISKF